MARQTDHQCDCCGEMVAEVNRCWAFGIETFACGKCRGEDEPLPTNTIAYGRELARLFENIAAGPRQ